MTLTRRTPLRARLRLPRRRRDTGPTRATRAWVIVRDDSCCVRCGRFLNFGEYEYQHRLPRGIGGSPNPAVNLPANLILLGGASACGCHRYVETHRSESYGMGWLVHRWCDPAEVPVWYRGTDPILLDNNGGWRHA